MARGAVRRDPRGCPCRNPHCYPDFYTAQDAVAADRGGELVFVFAKNDRKQGPNSLYVSRSGDGGSTWSAPALIERERQQHEPGDGGGSGGRRL